MTLLEELTWRGSYHDSIPETGEYLNSSQPRAYIGYDPTAPSLHIGNLATIMLLVHLQRHGGKPFILMGGATGRIGDPSGKKSERTLLSEEVIEANLQAQKSQFSKFLDFDGNNSAELVNNFDWYENMNVLSFLRDVGKHLTVNYMMAKDSVKSRLDSGLSFTEFSYQLLQGFDFHHLYSTHNVKLQMGGSDQWGNITAGTELIRRMSDGKAYALTCPLITKADGSKFGKSESGNIWLDPSLTSPYKFYQYFINTTDEEAITYLKVFSLRTIDEIQQTITDHEAQIGARIAQKALADELTTLVHSEDELNTAKRAASILFGKASKQDFEELSKVQFLEIFEAVPQSEISRALLIDGLPITELSSTETNFLTSNSEVRRALKEGSLKLNKQAVKSETIVGEADLLLNEFLLLQRGKKKYHLVRVV